jgi:hypothetical protein
VREWGGADRSLRANAYAMEFRDEIALVGLTTPARLRRAAERRRSYRRGVELEGRVAPPRGPLALAAARR